MIKLIALYKKPADEAAFLRHYENVHLPLARKIPGITDLAVHRAVAAPLAEEPPYFLVGEVSFPNREAFENAMRSKEFRDATDDVMGFAEGLVTALAVERQQ